MAKKELTYEEAMTRVEEIVGRIQREEVSVDGLAAEVAQATKLIENCRARLQKAEAEVDKVLEER
ncbi:MAG: exodeoxyribonuclease VII small subunit [Alistipes sp.]|nr:exodeoxyribonuclease VII small subunit [Alistipes sp.]